MFSATDVTILIYMSICVNKSIILSAIVIHDMYFSIMLDICVSLALT